MPPVSTRKTVARSMRRPARSPLPRAVACVLLLGMSATAAAQEYMSESRETGEIGDPDSWVTNEFNVDWGLGAINAHHAYARGLSGAGIRLGVLDSGAMAGHPEFAASGRLHSIGVAFEYTNVTLTADGTMATLLFGDHGAHTAGTIAASRNGVGMHGVAFGSDLFAANDNALGDTGALLDEIVQSVNQAIDDFNETSGRPSPSPHLGAEEVRALLPAQWGSDFDPNIIAGNFDALAEQGVRVISNSWGKTAKLGDGFADVKRVYEDAKKDDQPWHDAVIRAVRDHDTLFVFAAGNSSGVPDASGNVVLTHADVEPTLPAFIPELSDHWVSVVAVDRNLELSVWRDSGAGSSICGETRQWCIAAPGTAITSTGFDPYDDSMGRLNLIAVTLSDANEKGFEGSVYEKLEQNRRDILDSATPEEVETLKALYHSVGIDITQPDVFATALDDILATEHEPLYVDKDGTSMATPHVSGALGLLFERFPYLTATQVRDVMFTTATDLGEEGVDEIFGWGLLDLEKAIEGPGMLRYDTVVVMDRAAGGAKVWEGDAWDDWSNDIDGPGRLFKEGAGWLRLSGDNSFASATVREGILELDGDNTLADGAWALGGALILNGSLQDTELQVHQNGSAIIEGTVTGGTWVGGWLGGNGTLGHTTIAGTVAPGDGFDPGIGTLSFDGDYTQADGSFYRVDLASDASDRIAVGGSAQLEGGAVAPVSMPGESVLGRSYRILSAGDGVTGSFAGLDAAVQELPFLDFNLVYLPFAVDLEVSRGASFASVAESRNRISVATAMDGLADSDPLLQSLIHLNAGQATAAFDPLSGELYPSLRSVLVESSRAPRVAAMTRAGGGTDGFAMQAHEGRGNGLWIDARRGGGHIGGDGNAHRIDHNSRDLLLGYDHRFDAGWLVGMMIGTGRTDFDLPGFGDRGHADNRLFGAYGSGHWGGLGVRAAWI